MSDEWDFYLCRINDQLASVFLDMGIRSDAPMASLPHVVRVRVPMLYPREDGLSSQQEFDELVRIEDSMKVAIEGRSDLLVGRTTQAGVRDFYFYATDPDGVIAALRSAAEGFSEYQVEIGSFDDPEWEEYFGFLYPSARDRQRMANRRTLEALQRHGDALTTPRPIAHWIYLPSEGAADQFLTAASDLGFARTAEVTMVEGPLAYQASVSSVAVPSIDTMNDITLQLFELAEAHDGEYDGWECPVETA